MAFQNHFGPPCFSGYILFTSFMDEVALKVMQDQGALARLSCGQRDGPSVSFIGGKLDSLGDPPTGTSSAYSRR
jgi:hypothetical protein